MKKRISAAIRKPRFKKYEVSYFAKIFVLFLIYFATAKIGLKFDAVSGFATLVWPPTGIAIAALLLYGVRLWPGIALAAFLVNFTQGATLGVAAGISLGNTLEALVAFYLLREFSFKIKFERLIDVFIFVFFACIVSTFVSAFIGPLSLLAGGAITQKALPMTWLAWWVGDMLGALVVAPPILLWRLSYPKTLKILRLFEFILYAIIFAFVAFMVFYLIYYGFPISYALYVPLLIISLRFGPKEETLSILFLSALAIWATVVGYDIFGIKKDHLSQNLLLLQSFIAVTSTTFLSLSVIMQEKREFESRKDEFLAIASHELKTPITTAKAYVDLIKRRFSGKNKNLDTYIGRADEQIIRLIKLINDMLDITRISAGKIELGLEKFPISEHVLRVVRDFRKTAKKQKIIFKSSSRYQILADKYKITQVLTNLISNAIKFSPDGREVVVKVSSNTRHVIISVRDFGIGIRKADQRDIFKRFFQVKRDGQDEKMGLGLGLYISSEIVKKHGGRIWVKSNNRGTVFFFTLPKST